MNLKDFIQEPKLVEITLDDDAIIERYGGPIKFWAYDHIQLSQYFKFFDTRIQGQYDELETITRSLIRNEDGSQLIPEGKTLPSDIFASAIVALGNLLGKSQSKAST